MLRRRHQYRLLSAAFLFALVGLAFFGSYAGMRSWDSHHSTAQPPVEPRTAYIEKEPETLLEKWLDPVALCTLALVVVTGLMACIIAEQVRLAREEFIASHRPKIRVRYIQAPSPNVGVPKAIIIASNVGDSEARVVRMGADIFLRQRGQAPTNGFDASPKDKEVIVPPGKDARIEMTSRLAPLTLPVVSSIVGGTLELCLVAIISYADKNGTERTTSLFRVWNHTRRRFARSGPNDEFAEWEFED